MRLKWLFLGLTLSATLVPATGRADCIPTGPDDTSCVAAGQTPGNGKCEDATARAVALLARALVVCNLRDSGDKMRRNGSPTDVATCQQNARDKFDEKLQSLKDCPPCLDRDAVRDLAIELINENGGSIFCDQSGTQCGGGACLLDTPNTGFAPGSKSVQKCEDGAARAASRLVTAVIRCHLKNLGALQKQKPFDVEQCKTAAKTKFDHTCGKLPHCPSCLDANARAAIRDRIEEIVDDSSDGAFCGTTTTTVPGETSTTTTTTEPFATRCCVTSSACGAFGACVILSGSECAESGGIDVGPGTCGADVCPPTTTSTTTSTTLPPITRCCVTPTMAPGSACGAFSACVVDTPAECQKAGGIDVGPGECGAGVCPPPNAPTTTTLPGGTTTTTTTTIGGGTTSSTVIVPTTSTTTITTTTVPGEEIRCCVTGSTGGAFGTCVVETPAACSSAGGANLGPGMCEPGVCPPGTTSTSTTSTTPPASSTTTTIVPPTTSTTSVSPTTTVPTTSTSSTVVSTTTPSTVAPTTTVVISTTSTTTPTASQLAITLTAATANCGGAGLSSPPSPPLSGQLDGSGGKIVDLGLGCLYFGGGNNTSVPGAALPDGSTTILDVKSANGSTLTLGAHAGPSTECTQGAGPAKHCAKASATSCAVDGDCGSNGPCLADANCFFGPPLPIPNPNAPGVSSCVLNVVNVDATGTIDETAGTSSSTISLSSRVYLTGTSYDDPSTTAIEACPRCIAGKCNGGKNANGACVSGGPKLTSVDCPPSEGQFIAPLGVPLGLTTATSTSSNATGAFCSGQTHAGAFGQSGAHTISETGSAAGDLTDGAQHAAQLASTFCVPKTGNALIDPVADLPGPGATAIPTLLQLQ